MATTSPIIPEFTLQDRIVKARHVRGLSQAGLAAELGIGFKTLQRYEQGLAEPPKAVLLGLALTCGVDPQWIVTGSATDSDTHEEIRPIAA